MRYPNLRRLGNGLKAQENLNDDSRHGDRAQNAQPPTFTRGVNPDPHRHRENPNDCAQPDVTLPQGVQGPLWVACDRGTRKHRQKRKHSEKNRRPLPPGAIYPQHGDKPPSAACWFRLSRSPLMSTNHAFDHLVAPFLFFLFSVRFAAEIEIIRKILHVLATSFNSLRYFSSKACSWGVADLITRQGPNARPRP
jgi:hypothetical protein